MRAALQTRGRIPALSTFGVNLTYGRMHPREGSDGLYDEMLESAVCADRLGFETVWLAEHHMMFGLQLPNPLIAAAQLAQHVKCRIGTAALVLPYRHPLMVAGEIAAVDQISGGRLDVGVCRGAYPYEFKRFGVPYEKSKEMMFESLEALDVALTSDAAESFDGDFYSYGPTLTWPRPVQGPRPPIYVSAMSESTIEWAVERRFNVLIVQFFQPIEHVCHQAEVFHRKREELGISREDIKLSVLTPSYTSEDAADVREKAEAVMRRNRIHQHLMNYDETMTDLANYKEPGPAPNEPSIDDVIERTMIDRPEALREKAERVFEAGVDQIQLHVAWGLDAPEAIQSMECFAGNVLGHFAPAAAA
jgi:alkanesulfonate monooxygenase SsuD/methylene tetrahydromethanopterin reductase-like flavin-dependent oxidoreductase (luciferase family)